MYNVLSAHLQDQHFHLCDDQSAGPPYICNAKIKVLCSRKPYIRQTALTVYHLKSIYNFRVQIYKAADQEKFSRSGGHFLPSGQIKGTVVILIKLAERKGETWVKLASRTGRFFRVGTTTNLNYYFQHAHCLTGLFLQE